MNPIIQKDQKIYNLHYNDVRGDVLRSPHGATLAAVKINLLNLLSLSMCSNVIIGVGRF